MKKTKPERNSGKTRKKILEAVGKLLARKGFGGLGINAIAQEARVGKVLIYRYFGGLKGLLEAFIEEGDHWPSVDQYIADMADSRRNGDDAVAFMKRFFIDHARGLRNMRLTQEILKWELLKNSDLSARLAEVRERRGEALFALWGDELVSRSGFDVRAFVALMGAGINYLVLKSTTNYGMFAGINIHTDEGWNRLENMMLTLIDSAVKKNLKIAK